MSCRRTVEYLHKATESKIGVDLMTGFRSKYILASVAFLDDTPIPMVCSEKVFEIPKLSWSLASPRLSLLYRVYMTISTILLGLEISRRHWTPTAPDS